LDYWFAQHTANHGKFDDLLGKKAKNRQNIVGIKSAPVVFARGWCA